jgi:hypothetical protein
MLTAGIVLCSRRLCGSGGGVTNSGTVGTAGSRRENSAIKSIQSFWSKSP